MRYEPVQVEHVVRDTDAAFLFLVNGEEKWVPKSVVESPDDVIVGGFDQEIGVAEWFVAREEL